MLELDLLQVCSSFKYNVQIDTSLVDLDICEGKIIYVDIYDYLICFNINSFGRSNILSSDFSFFYYLFYFILYIYIYFKDSDNWLGMKEWFNKMRRGINEGGKRESLELES